MDNNLELNQTLTEEDYISFSKYYYKTSPHAKRNRNSQFTFIVLFAFSFGLLMSVITQNWTHLIRAPFTFLVIGYPVFILLSKWSIRQQIHFAKKTGALGTLGSETLSLTPEGLKQVDSSGETLALWKTFLHVKETGDYAYAFIAPNRAFVIKKESDRGDIRHFINELRLRIENVPTQDGQTPF